NGSGIYRNVRLIETNFTHFNNYDGVYITTPIAEEDKAVVNVDYKIFAAYLTADELKQARAKRYYRDSKPYVCEIRSIVYDDMGLEVARTIEHKTINSFDKYVRHTQQVAIDNPIRWSAENPKIYYMRSEIILENKVIDDKITTFGIRKLEYNKDKGMLVNDKQVKLDGVCLHHDAASLGAAVPDDVWHYRLSKLRDMGCNAIRTSHNPFSPEFYAMCDTMGFYVMDECFDEWKDGWPFNYTENPQGKAQNSYHLYFDQWAETDLKDMIRRDRNHPSVIMYGIGNEVPFFKDPTAGETTRKLMDICRSEDPTRPVALGNNASEHTIKNGVDAAMDIMGYNYIMRQHPDSLYAPTRRLMPDKLFLGSETDRNIKYFLAYRDNDYVLGQFIWTGIDYLGETRKAPQRGWQAALLDVTCNPRHEGLLFECCWSDEPKALLGVANLDQDAAKYIYMHGDVNTPILNTNPEKRYTRSWDWSKGDSLSVNIYSNCQEVELRLNGKKIARKKNDMMTYTTTFDIVYAEGTLEAIGYNDTWKVTSDKLKSASAPAKIVANAVSKTLKADGRSVSVIEVDICDKMGNLASKATNNVAVKVEGCAQFIGMDTGNLYYDGNFKTPNRSATGGKLLVYVQSLPKAGEAKVTLTSEGLAPAVVNIKVVK
ncbi:MAG: glycoside hydrolase family 2 TIM barrel-domain containing protein, partial [Rikenellaceae bacterium]